MISQREFIDYLSSLAPEGETVLLVRQKPKLKDGALDFHADGAVKCTWPAMLPTAKIDPSWSIYANTGSFIQSRFVDMYPRASADNCEYVLVLLLDDVGDTEKAPNIPPLAPTWKIETSKGCYQWAYVMCEQPKKAEYAAAIIAITNAGYGDKGAINAVRNFRIPGSVNIKPDKNGFVSQLVEFTPDNEYTLAQVCQALKVTPGADIKSIHHIALADDGKDDVMSWLRDKTLVLTNNNGSGWYGVKCPNSDAHSDGNPEGRYLPLNRAYCCYHSSCSDWDSERFLDWVAEQGGPDHQSGLRDTILAEVMAGPLSKLTPNDIFSDDGAKHIAEVELREMGRIERSEWAKKFAYVMPDDAYFNLSTQTEVSRKTFNAIFRHIDCRSVHGKHPRVEAAISFDEHRQPDGAVALDGLTYAPGEPPISVRLGRQYGNRWVNARIAGSDGDAKPWLKHLQKIIPDPVEQNHLLDVMAFKLQHPEIKINHAILLAGNPGAGKDTLFAPFITAVCGPANHNRSLVDMKTLDSSFGYALESEIMIINELRPDQFRDRRALENQLKPIIAAPPEVLSVNRKNMHPYDALNRILVIAFSNFRDAIALPADDRRWCVMWTYAAEMTVAESERIWSWYRAGGFEAVAGLLYRRDVTAFKPGAKPPMTEAKMIMSAQSMSPTEAWITDQITGRIGEFATGAIGAPLYRIIDRLQGQHEHKITSSALLHALKEAGWRDMGRLNTTELSKKQVWCAADMVNCSKSELRRLVEAIPAPPNALLTRVK